MQFRSARRRVFAVLLAGLFLPLAAGAQTMQLKVGDKAPMFPNPLPSTAGESAGAVSLDLGDALGRKNIVLAFYVADWTGG